jgi:hypothetical protein
MLLTDNHGGLSVRLLHNERYFYKPKSYGLVKGKRVGRQNRWMLIENGGRVPR